MTSNPASRRMRATTFTPRSWPSRPTLATRIRWLTLRSPGGVVVEPATGLAAKQPRLDHPGQQRWRREQRLLELGVETLGHRHGGVQADEVGQAQRPHRVVA